MRKIISAIGLCLSLSIFSALANPQDDEFEKIAKDYCENYLASHPEFSTELGDHRFDGALTDYSSESRTRMLANAKQVREALKKFDDYKQLTGANQVDVRILRENIDYEIFRLEEFATPNGTRSFTTRAWPTVFISWSRVISIPRKSAFQICASGWTEFRT